MPRIISIRGTTLFVAPVWRKEIFTPARIALDHAQIAAFCQRWQITEFALFGSVLRDDFRPDSDVDVLVTFAPAAHWRLRDYVTMQDELETMFGRPVDLVERPDVEASSNPFRRKSILRNVEPIYAS